MSEYQWYPGHMTRAVRMMKEQIRLVDLIIELTDARVPLSSRNPDIDKLGKGKDRLLILNKADLADPRFNEAWISYFQEKGLAAITLNSKNRSSVKALQEQIALATRERKEKDRKKGLVGKPLRAMVAGIPNVGKSTLINLLHGRGVAKTGNKPGVTKGKQWITMGRDLQVLDTPGILWPRFEDQQTGLHLAMIGSMNDENLDRGDLSMELIHFLEEAYPGTLKEGYQIAGDQMEKAMEEVSKELPMVSDDTRKALAILNSIAANRHFLKSGARPDLERAEKLLLDDFRNGRLNRISIERPEDIMDQAN